MCVTTSLLVQPPLQTTASADIYCGPFSLASVSFCGFYSFPQCSTLGTLPLLLILHHHHSLHADVMIPFVLFARWNQELHCLLILSFHGCCYCYIKGSLRTSRLAIHNNIISLRRFQDKIKFLHVCNYSFLATGER